MFWLRVEVRFAGTARDENPAGRTAGLASWSFRRASARKRDQSVTGCEPSRGFDPGWSWEGRRRRSLSWSRGSGAVACRRGRSTRSSGFVVCSVRSGTLAARFCQPVGGGAGIFPDQHLGGRARWICRGARAGGDPPRLSLPAVTGGGLRPRGAAVPCVIHSARRPRGRGRGRPRGCRPRCWPVVGHRSERR